VGAAAAPRRGSAPSDVTGLAARNRGATCEVCHAPTHTQPFSALTPADTCASQVAGCAQLLVGEVHGKEYNRRYRLCQVHLRSEEVVLGDGVASRWCQTCSRWQPLAAFTGAKRSCAEQLSALRRRRRARAAAQHDSAAAAAQPQAQLQAPNHEEADFLDWLAACVASPPAPAAALLDSPTLLRPAALFADLSAAWHPLAPPAPPPPDAPPPPPLPAPLPPRALSFSIKLPHATPDALPPSLAPALAAWADEPLSLFAAAQPGCTLLTVDVLLRGDAATHAAQEEALQAALRGCGAPGGALSGARFALAAAGDAGRAPPLALAVVHAHSCTLTVAFAAPVAAGALRCRAHGALLHLAQAGAAAVAVSLPPSFTHGLLLFDVAPRATDADAPLMPPPRALLATRDGAIAAELAAGSACESELWLLGNALHGAAGSSDAEPELLSCAAACAARRGWLAALGALLAALGALPAEWREGLLAAGAGGARPAHAARMLLRAGGFGAPHAALRAAAMACASRDGARAADAADAARALSAHGAGGLAWHARDRDGDGGDAASPAQRAARAPAAAALCAELRARLAAAHALLAELHAALPPSAASPPAAARAALLAAAPRPLAPGAEAEAATEAVRVADLAFALLAHAQASAATLVVPAASLRWHPLRALSPRRLALVRLLLFAAVQPSALSALVALALARRPPATAAEFRAAAAAGEVPARFLLPSRGLGVASVLGPLYAAAALTAALLPERAVGALLAHADAGAAAMMLAIGAIFLALSNDVWLLHDWRPPPGAAPVLWSHAAAALQLLMTAVTVTRTLAWAPRLAAFTLAARAGMLAAAYAAAGHAVPLTRAGGAVAAAQAGALRALAAWRVRARPATAAAARASKALDAPHAA
jgi:hypothetical protein